VRSFNTFSFFDGVAIEIVFQVSDTTLDIVLTTRYTPAVLLSLILGLYFGIFSQFQLVVQRIDPYIEMLKKLCARNKVAPSTTIHVQEDKKDEEGGGEDDKAKKEKDEPKSPIHRLLSFLWQTLAFLVCLAVLAVIVTVMYIPQS